MSMILELLSVLSLEGSSLVSSPDFIGCVYHSQCGMWYWKWFRLGLVLCLHGTNSSQVVTQSLLPPPSPSPTVWWYLQFSVHCIWEGSGWRGAARRRGRNSQIHLWSVQCSPNNRSGILLTCPWLSIWQCVCEELHERTVLLIPSSAVSSCCDHFNFNKTVKTSLLANVMHCDYRKMFELVDTCTKLQQLSKVAEFLTGDGYLL